MLVTIIVRDKSAEDIVQYSREKTKRNMRKHYTSGFEIRSGWTERRPIMANTIFLKGENNHLIELRESPYSSEDVFQKLIEQNPAILAGGQIEPEDPLRWILIAREMGVPSEEGGSNQWFLDHLFVDQNGVPTFVEVKRSTDTRIRREVVGQMLDYAANATEYWNISDIRQIYEKTGRTLEDDFSFDDMQAEEFWTKINNNLRYGKIRLLFVADTIPKTLLRVIEFLNNQMVNTEILGLEIKQYLSDDNRQIFVSKVVGQTVQANDVKKSEKREWDHDSFLDDVERVGGTDVKNLADRIMTDFEAMGCRIWFGKGYTHSSIVIIYDGECASTQLISVYPWKKAVYSEIYFKHFKAPFGTIERRKLLKEKFDDVLKIAIPEKKLQGRPSFPFEKLMDEQTYQNFIEIIQYIIDNIKALDTLV